MKPILTALRANPILKRLYKEWQPRPGRNFLDDALNDLSQLSKLTTEEQTLRAELQNMPSELRKVHSRNFGDEP